MPRAAAAAPSGGRAEAAPSVLPLQARGAGLRDVPKPPQGGAPLEPPPLEAAISAWARDVRALRDDFARRRADAADASARAPGASETAGSPVAEHARRRSAEQMGLTCALLDLLAKWDRDVQAVRVQFEQRRAAVHAAADEEAMAVLVSPRTLEGRESGAWY